MGRARQVLVQMWPGLARAGCRCGSGDLDLLRLRSLLRLRRERRPARRRSLCLRLSLHAQPTYLEHKGRRTSTAHLRQTLPRAAALAPLVVEGVASAQANRYGAAAVVYLTAGTSLRHTPLDDWSLLRRRLPPQSPVRTGQTSPLQVTFPLTGSSLLLEATAKLLEATPSYPKCAPNTGKLHHLEGPVCSKHPAGTRKNAP